MVAGPPRAALLAALLVAVPLAGCAKGTESESNLADSFRYSAEWQGFGGTKAWTWQNSRPRAELSLQGTATAGTVGATITDPAGSVVFRNDALQPEATRFFSQEGQPGAWRIELRFSGFSGDITFSARAAAAAPSG